MELFTLQLSAKKLMKFVMTKNVNLFLTLIVDITITTIIIIKKHLHIKIM